jgi:hypothetical protein
VSTRIALPGAGGRMGRMIAQVIGETEGAELTAAFERPGSPHLGQAIAPGVTVDSDAERALERAQVLIDFTAPEATARLAEQAAARGVAMVIGTTGLGEPELARIRAAAQRIPIVLSANMSLGVNVLFGLLQQAARARRRLRRRDRAPRCRWPKCWPRRWAATWRRTRATAARARWARARRRRSACWRCAAATSSASTRRTSAGSASGSS